MSSQLQMNSANDDIDLIELLKTLWGKKIWVLISTFVFTTIAGMYAFTAKEQWTSKVELVAPEVQDLGSYFNVRKEYARISGVEFDSKALANSLFTQFNLALESLDEQQRFFNQSSLYQKLTEGKSENEQRIILSKLINEGITIAKPDPKKEPNLLWYSVSFSTETPEEAKVTLNEFIKFINQKVYQVELKRFLTNIDKKLLELYSEKLKIEQELEFLHSTKIEKLHNLEQLSKNKVGKSGKKNQQAQIEQLVQKPATYPLKYYQVSASLRELEVLLSKARNAKANAFSYHASPDYLVTQDKPKRLFILLGGAVIGGFLSLIVLAINYVLEQNRRSENKG